MGSVSVESMAGSKQVFGRYEVAQDAEWLTFVSQSPGSESMVVKTLHVSCRSDKFDPKKNFVGFVIYKYLGQDAWILNNVRCKSGYIYFIESSKLDCVKGDTLHARAFYNLVLSLSGLMLWALDLHTRTECGRRTQQLSTAFKPPGLMVKWPEKELQR